MPPLYGFLTCMYGLSGIEEAPWNPARQTPYSRPPGPTPNNPDTPYNLTHRHLRAGGDHPGPRHRTHPNHSSAPAGTSTTPTGAEHCPPTTGGTARARPSPARPAPPPAPRTPLPTPTRPGPQDPELVMPRTRTKRRRAATRAGRRVRLPRPPQGESPTMTVTVPAIDKNLDAACASVASEIARTDSKASLFSELLGSRGGRWRSFIRTRRVAVSHEIRWSLSGRKWLGPAQCFADTVRHSARRKVRIAGWSSPRVVE